MAPTVSGQVLSKEEIDPLQKVYHKEVCWVLAWKFSEVWGYFYMYRKRQLEQAKH